MCSAVIQFNLILGPSFDDDDVDDDDDDKVKVSHTACQLSVCCSASHCVVCCFCL